MGTKSKRQRARSAARAKEAEVVRSPERPTDERRAHGTWAEPKGLAKHTSPIVDLACDMIGRLYVEKQITSDQEQAARTFQRVRAAWVEELGIGGYRSCIAESTSSYDSGEGNAAAVAEYAALCKRLGIFYAHLLARECDKPADGKPIRLEALRSALDRIAGRC